MNSVTLPIGSISVIDKIEKDLGLISGIFWNSGGKSKDFVGIAKLLLANRIEDTVSVHKLLPTSSKEKLDFSEEAKSLQKDHFTEPYRE